MDGTGADRPAPDHADLRAPTAIIGGMLAPLFADLCKLLWWTRTLAHRDYGRLVLRATAITLVVAIGLAGGGGELVAIDWSLVMAYAGHDGR